MNTESNPVAPAVTAAPSPIQPVAASVVPTTVAAPLSPQERMAARYDAAMQPPKPLVEELPPEVREIRNTPERRMFPADVTYRSAGIRTLFDGSPEAVDQARAWENVAADHDLSPNETSSLVRMVTEARRQPPSDETVAAWARDSMERVKQQYGTRADAVLADARRLAARDPRVKQLLLDSGLGSHPEVVSLFVAKASAMKAIGKLK